MNRPNMVVGIVLFLIFMVIGYCFIAPYIIEPIINLFI